MYVDTETTDRNNRITKDYNNIIIFFIFCSIYLAISVIERKMVYTSEAYYASFGEQLEYSRIQEMLGIQNKFEPLIFILIPILFLFKLTMVYFSIYTYLFLNKINISFKTLITSILYGELIFIFLSFFRLIWFVVIKDNYTVLDVTYFSPLSLLSIFKVSENYEWLSYALKTVNIFELIYIIVISYCISVNSEYRFINAFVFVAKSYGFGLLMWVLIVTFAYLMFI